ncbi:RICIN domain-containing protein [Xenorhabdus anantnagensis]|uniref:Ricin-type beta-trefoil lectin domain protein n=1 Tax=Xenorhabdus anantnagensis TaxID=3025875 RepID=A0ABT5LR47_9GAMM|nr:ricin-type beta-trefoil lectin domain protein [Xenorhabdus anantnagensis]MDC9596268.1 ricin-type beta-trefoil lectin domain protein [Xenorhabdus anantnagensis]
MYKKIILFCGFLLIYSSYVLSGQAPGTYTHYKFGNNVPEFDSFDFSITVNKDPGYTASIFWAGQFGLIGISPSPSVLSGGYTGLQSNGESKRTFIFSIWKATAAKVGSKGSICSKFYEGGDGYSCRMHLDWKVGHPYLFHVSYDGDSWLSVKVTDLADKTSFILGSIKTPATKISPLSIINWSEYYEGSDPRATCLGQPYSKATFSLPVGYSAGNKSIAEITSVNTGGDCKDFSKITTINSGSIHENGIGNSLRGVIKNNKLCLNISGNIGEGVNINTSYCSRNFKQSWVYSKSHYIETLRNYCLADDGGIKLKTCIHDTPGLKWEIKNNEIRKENTSLCLTNNGFGSNVTLSPCNGSPSQKWDTFDTAVN